MNPLDYIKRTLHVTPDMLARRLNVTRATIYRWGKNKGIIPIIYHDEILKFGKERGFKITLFDLSTANNK